MASPSSSLKRIHRSTTTTDPNQSHDVDSENKSKKSRLRSSVDHASSSSSQPQSSATPSMPLSSPLYQFHPLQLVDNGRPPIPYLDRSTNSYISPDFIKERKLSSRTVAQKRIFFEQCLKKLRQNDSNMLSLDISCRHIGEQEIPRFIEALAVNSSLLELGIVFQQQELTEVVASQLVKALKLNSTLTRLSLKDNRINDAAATQLSELLRCNTTLLSFDLSRTGLTENGITQVSAALCANTNLIHLDLCWNRITEAAATQLSKLLTVNSILTVLDLRSCFINETEAIQLSEALAGNHSLTKLGIRFKSASDIYERSEQRLRYNRFQRIHLTRLFQNDPSLTLLDLIHQRINGVGATRLSEALAVNSVLRELNLVDNIIDDRGMTRLNESSPGRQLSTYQTQPEE